MTTPALPDRVRDVDHLDDLLSDPSPGVVETMRRLDGDVLVLGVGGKMGPSLARMAKRASDAAGARGRRVVGVSRFSSPELPSQLQRWGVEPLTCDLLDPAQLARLPDAPNVVFMAGMKFGTTGKQSFTWAMNSFLPGLVAQRFRNSRVVAFSTGNVYPQVPVVSGGSVETDDPAPLGEYAQSCLGRERVFEHFSRTNGTSVSLIRLNYAVEMRYGVLVDLAQKVWSGAAIDLGMGNFNCVWQADANAWALQSFDHLASPPLVLNVTGPETLSVRSVCEAFGRVMGKAPQFVGAETGVAYLNNAGRAQQLFGYPRVGPRQLIEWTADWVMRGGASLGKPTHFETRDGKF
jgi:hypothetical protein